LPLAVVHVQRAIAMAEGDQLGAAVMPAAQQGLPQGAAGAADGHRSAPLPFVPIAAGSRTLGGYATAVRSRVHGGLNP
jgi:hypothetical protein